MMDENKQEPHKFERKEGVTYYQCQHLEEGLMEVEATIIWLGDKFRVILCPLCNKLEIGNVIYTMAVLRGESKRRRDKLWDRLIDWAFKHD